MKTPTLSGDPGAFRVSNEIEKKRADLRRAAIAAGIRPSDPVGPGDPSQISLRDALEGIGQRIEATRQALDQLRQRLEGLRRPPGPAAGAAMLTNTIQARPHSPLVVMVGEMQDSLSGIIGDIQDLDDSLEL